MKDFGAVILAAGLSRRLGFSKLSVIINGEPVIHKAVTPFVTAGVGTIVVVTGLEAQGIHEALNGYKVEFVENRDYQLGMSTSVKASIPFVAGTEGVFFHLGDKPFLERETLHEMAEVYRRNRKKIVVPLFKNSKGHPVLMNVDLYREEIGSLNGDRGLREIIDKHAEDVLFIKGNEGSLFDIDTIEDIDRLKERGYIIEKG